MGLFVSGKNSLEVTLLHLTGPPHNRTVELLVEGYIGRERLTLRSGEPPTTIVGEFKIAVGYSRNAEKAKMIYIGSKYYHLGIHEFEET